MIKIFYENHKGSRLDLMEESHRIVADDSLQIYQWEYESSSSNYSMGGRIERFHRKIVEKTIQITITGDIQQSIDEMLGVTEVDIKSLIPGRLYVNDCYLKCYIASGKNSGEWVPGVDFLRRDMTLVIVYPFWIREKSRSYGIQQEKVGKKYPYKYSCRYPASYGSSLTNSHYTESEFRMTIHGPCVNPDIYIGGHRYALGLTLLSGEDVTIDSAAGTIEKADVYGNKENRFDSRIGDGIFTPISSGTSNIQWDGRFTWEITLFQERSEPVWIL